MTCIQLLLVIVRGTPGKWYFLSKLSHSPSDSDEIESPSIHQVEYRTVRIDANTTASQVYWWWSFMVMGIMVNRVLKIIVLVIMMVIMMVM